MTEIHIEQLLSEVSNHNSLHPREFIQEVIKDYWICITSREASLAARKEVLTGKAKFGITGDGKEVPQVAMARAFKRGDFKAGYYRDQTFMMALGLCSIEDFFAQLYADQKNDPFSAGRQMNNHFASELIDESGNWIDQTNRYNISADISSTSGQMPRALGHALATKLFRDNTELSTMEHFNDQGKGLTVVSIGDASTSEGAFWETMNAAAVMQVPLATCVYDDGYGISVPVELQTVKGSISKALEGFYLDESGNGIRIYVVKGWDYPGLIEAFETGFQKCRNTQVPALFHIQQLTQPQGHSTSGSHERYKTPERLKWETEVDCVTMMAQWMVESNIITPEQLQHLNDEAKTLVREKRKAAWAAYSNPATIYKERLRSLLSRQPLPQDTQIEHLVSEINTPHSEISAGELLALARRLTFRFDLYSFNLTGLEDWKHELRNQFDLPLHTHLYAEGAQSPLNIHPVAPDVTGQELVNGSKVLNQYFKALFTSRADVVAFGEDVGQIGDVNQGFAGLQQIFSEQRIFDTGIRECTIIGQAIGLSMRGFRPIAEIQYLDYLTFAMFPLTDDLATLRYRTAGLQCAPAIIRTRGHRLEGIWHSGSPMALLLSSLRGMHICVPRDMTQAVGMYNTLLAGTDPGIVIECLNGYRLKEALPTNLLDYKIGLGIPEILTEGSDLTLVTYGSCIRIALEALKLIAPYEISVELIDIQTLLPFDRTGIIVESLKKTNKLLIVDEDVPGGATAFILQQVVEKWNGYQYLDDKPHVLTANEHRPPFGSDGDYFSKPNAEDIAEKIVNIMSHYKQLD